MLGVLHLKERKVFERSDTTSVPMGCLLLFYSWLTRISFARDSQQKHVASAAPMTGTPDYRIGAEWCIDKFVAIAAGSQLYRNTCRMCDRKWSLTNEMYFQCSEMDAAADTSMDKVPIVSAS